MSKDSAAATIQASNERLVWMDLEMTGLDPETCVIVQMAVIITDRELNPIGNPLDLVVWQPESALEVMDPFVRKMHKKSGLLDQIRNPKFALKKVDSEKNKVKSNKRLTKSGDGSLEQCLLGAMQQLRAVKADYGMPDDQPDYRDWDDD